MTSFHPAAKASAMLMEGHITGMTHDGRGVCRGADGKTVFVAGGLTDEKLLYRVIRQRRDFDEALAEQILQASNDRVVPRCAHFGICGGCTLQHLSPEAQRLNHQQQLGATLMRIGHIQPERWLPPLTGPVWGYRHRARLSVRYVKAKGRVLVGFREHQSSYVTDLRACPVLHPWIGEKLEPLAQMIGKLSLARTIPQVEVAVGDNAVVLVLRVLEMPDDNDRRILKEFALHHGIHFYLQPNKPSPILPLDPADTPVLGYSLPAFDLNLQFKPLDFIQVNPQLNQAMVSAAVELLAPEPDSTVVDLFCGLGNFTLPLAKLAGRVTGVEGEHSLIERARENARNNGLENVTFYTTDLFAPDAAAAWCHSGCDYLLLDPPRAGAREVISLMPYLHPRRIVYISCHPATLARDADQLVNKLGFNLKCAGIMDMFPHTGHVESIAVFEPGTVCA